jgi:hypothetical protein
MDSYGTATALSNAAGLNSLTANSFANLGTIDNTTTLADDYLVEIALADFSETANEQMLVYVRTSVDGTNFSEDTLPANLVRIGFFSVDKAATVRSRAFSVAAAFGGVLPPKFDVIVRNDAGATTASSGNAAQYVAVTF